MTIFFVSCPDNLTKFRYCIVLGRARAKPSQFIVMTEEGSDWYKDWDAYKRIENMQIEGCHDVFEENEDSDHDDEEVYYANPEDPIYRLIVMRSNYNFVIQAII